MSNHIWSGWKELIGRWGIDDTGVSQPAGQLRVGLVSSSYTFSAAHDFLDDIAAGGGSIVSSMILPSPTFTGKTLTGGNITFTALGGVISVKALLLYMHTGTASTSRLVAYIDTNVQGLPFTPSGSDVVLTWDSVGILDL